MEGLSKFLLNCNIDTCYLSNDAEFVWNVIDSHIQSAMDLFIPKRKRLKPNTPCWYNSEIRHRLKCLCTLTRKNKKKPTLQSQLKQEAYEKDLLTKMMYAKIDFERNLLSSYQSSKTNRIFKYIHKITGHRAIPTTITYKSSQASEDTAKASLFNRYFQSVFTQSSFKLPLALPPPEVSISHITIVETDVYKALISLDPDKAMGIDGIGPKILKYCSLSLYKPLHHLFSLCLSQHCIPEQWKIHLITPIHKSGDKSAVRNYRPISLLCSISKVLEKLIYNHLISTNISDSQFDFLPNRSTLQQLLLFVNEIINSHSPVEVIYLDFKKAFDSVAHHELLHKLWNFGITGNVWYWLKNYLTNRYQCVSINGQVSSPLPVLSGVPQGSILGPLLFLIYINDLPPCVLSSFIFLYADDAKCLKPINSIQDCQTLQCDLDALTSWSHKWSLSFNVEKCASMSYCTTSNSSDPPHIFHIDGQQVSPNNTLKDLGVIMTKNIDRSRHHQYILAKAYRMLNLLRRTFCVDNCHNGKKVLYLTLVRSRLTYSSPIWRPNLLRDISSLEKLQRRVTKYILNDFSSNYKNCLTCLKIIPLMMFFEMMDILFFVSCLKHPSSHFNILNYVTLTNTSTRSSCCSKLMHHLSKTNKERHFYFHRLPRLWNSLPVINIQCSLKSIKRKLFIFLWNHFTLHFNPDIPCTYHFVCPCSTCSSKPISFNFTLL